MDKLEILQKKLIGAIIWNNLSDINPKWIIYDVKSNGLGYDLSISCDTYKRCVYFDMHNLIQIMNNTHDVVQIFGINNLEDKQLK